MESVLKTMDTSSTMRTIDQRHTGEASRLKRSAILLEVVFGAGVGGSLWYYEAAPGHDPLLLQAALTALAFMGISALLSYLRWSSLTATSLTTEAWRLKVSAVLVETGLAIVVLTVLWDYVVSGDTTLISMLVFTLVIMGVAALSIRSKWHAVKGKVSSSE